MKATKKKKSTMKWGIASSHLTSQSPRLSRGESWPVRRSGYGEAVVSMTEPLCRQIRRRVWVEPWKCPLAARTGETEAALRAVRGREEVVQRVPALRREH